MKTTTPKVPATSTWVLVDATGQTIGRLASRVALVLRGKHKVSFTPHQICGEHVIITNIEKLAVSPNKALKKIYHDHTGHPGGYTARSLGMLMTQNPAEVLERAVQGMLPKNRMRAQLMKRLHLVQGSEHKYAAQKPTEIKLVKEKKSA